MDLIVDGQVVRTASGDSRERLAWKVWNVDALRGKQAKIQIVDQHVGGWGHINVDQVLLSDEPARAADLAGRWADYGADFYAAVSWNDVPDFKVQAWTTESGRSGSTVSRYNHSVKRNGCRGMWRRNSIGVDRNTIAGPASRVGHRFCEWYESSARRIL